jgi:hypothetical protein
MQRGQKVSAERLRNTGIYNTVRGCWLYEPGADLPVRCLPPFPLVVFSTPLKTLVFHIWVVNTTYYIETIDFWIREKIFKHQYGGSPNNVALFLIFSRNTSTLRTNLTNKRSAQNAGNGISGLQISKIFWGRTPPDSLWKTSTPLTNQARSAHDVNIQLDCGTHLQGRI